MQVLLVSALALRAGGHCYVSREINRFSKSFQVANIKMLVSRISRLGFRISELDLFEAQVLFRFCLITQCSLRSLPDLSRKIERFERLPFLFFTLNLHFNC